MMFGATGSAENAFSQTGPSGPGSDKLREALRASKTPRETGFNRKGKIKPKEYMIDRLSKDAAMLQQDPAKLGFSEAEQQQMTEQAAQGAQAQRSAAQTELGRQALAGQGFQAGAFQEASRDIAADAAQDVAQASSEVSALNEQKIQQEKQRILQEIDAERTRRAEQAKFWAQFSVDTAETIGEAIFRAMGM